MLGILLESIPVSTDYKFNEYEKIITNCYTDSTTLVYNKNIQEITIELTPSGKQECEQFPAGVEAQLVLKNTANDIKSTVIADFKYNETNEIIFRGINDFDDETFATMHLFSYNLITTVDIFVFLIEKSALANCYLPNSTAKISFKEDDRTMNTLVLSLSSTGLCTEQIVTSATNTLMSAEINIMGTKLDLDVNDIITTYLEYQTYNDATSYSVITKTDIPQATLASIKQLAIISGTIDFTSRQGQKEVTFSHTVGSFLVSGMNYVVPVSSLDPETEEEYGKFGDVVFWHPNYVVIGLWNDKFVCRAENHPLYDEYLKEKYDAIKITHYTIRLTGVLNDEQVSIQRTYFETTWDSHRKIFEFKCDQGSKEEEEQCKRFYQKAVSQQAEYVFDVLFFNDKEFIFHERQLLAEVPSCWKSAIMQKQDNKICVNLITRDNTDVCDELLPKDKEVNAVLTFEFMNLNTIHDFSLPQFYVYDTIVIDRSVAQYCMDCNNIKFDLVATPEYWQNTCTQNRKDLLKENLIVNVMVDSLDNNYYFQASGLIVVTDRMATIDYKATQIVTFVFGGIAIVVCVIIALFGIINIERTLEYEKKRKHEKD